jgi:Ca2+-binding EF-hand superfamily protein
LKEVLGVGKKLGNEKIWKEIISEVDINGDGVINYDEFCKMMKTFLK